MPHKYTAQEIENAFWERVNISGPNECWEWQRAINKNGYGKFRVSGKVLNTHRLAYEYTNGPIPNGLFVCHSCDNPPCCNPAHLWLGTAKDNAIDSVNKGRRATGNRSGARLHPERFIGHNIGDANGSRLHPESRPRGECHGMVKITENDVREIRRLYDSGAFRNVDLAKRYGISQTQAYRITHRKRWTHIP